MGYVGETAWSCPTADGTNDVSCLQASNPGGSTGGGVSFNFSRPTFQNLINPPGVTLISTNTNPATKRLVPDISLNGNPASGLPVFVNGSCTPLAPTCSLGGGTSASAPLLAGITALAAQKLMVTNGPAAQVGSLNSFLYSTASGSSWLNDVTSGYNGGGSTARAGWDYLTGLGSIKDANFFINSLVAYDIGFPVTSLGDSGPGTLRDALTRVGTGGSIKINVLGTTTVLSTLPAVKSGVSIIGSCASGPGLIIKSGLSTTLSPPPPGLQLSGNNTLFGVSIQGFKGAELVAKTRGNKLSCVKLGR